MLNASRREGDLMRKLLCIVAGFVVFAALLPTGTALAQAVYGSIVGTVVDATGAGVPNAKITITDLGRDVSFTTTSNESGNFSQRYLIVGRYRVRVEAQGFQAFVQENIGVS